MKKLVLVAVAVVVVLLAAIVVWQVLDRGEQTVRGSCGDATYELTAEEEQGDTQLTFELQSAAPGETWLVVIEQDGKEVLSSDRVTEDDGELEVEVLVNEDDGRSFTVTATPEGDGEPCAASLET